MNPDPVIRGEQIGRRQALIAAAETVAVEMEVDDWIIIQVLLVLLRHPGSKAADVVRYLRGDSPAITMAQVRIVFARYELDRIDKKGGASNC
ncbi:MAG: hypothetical protein GY949_09595 [Gammaproteobacteria bacterium]|nr:hypothetical protein [Gammaproteobacteria bacterium]